MPTLNLHKDFQSGRYKALLNRNLSHKDEKKYLASLIGAMSFLGRMEEATALFESHTKSAQSVDLMAARFFLAIGWTRRSAYKKAQTLFDWNKKRANNNEIERFFVHQGNVFFLYYTGRIMAALKEAEKSFHHAIKAKDVFAKSLAADALGNCHVISGKIHVGLKLLNDAADLAKKMGNQSLANGILSTKELYEAEYGIGGEQAIKKLEARAEASGTEDSFSLSNVSLELARQYTFQGRFQEATAILEKTAPLVYANQNRRHEITLNLRLAELAGRQGELFQTKHFLWFAKRLIDQEVDSRFELAALGIERKLMLADGKAETAEEITRIDKRWKELEEFSSNRDRNLRVRLGKLPSGSGNPEDLVHSCLIQAKEKSTLVERMSILLKANYLAEISLQLKLYPGKKSIVIFPGNLGLLIQSKERIVHTPPLSSLQYKLLRLLARPQATSKEELVSLVWGYRYDQLRHDNMLYAALSALRKSLSIAGDWLQSQESGYRIEAELISPSDPKEEPASPKDSQHTEPQPAPINRPLVPQKLYAQLNYRQIEILSWLQTKHFIHIKDCCKKFGVSEITALRDLDGLRRAQFVVRTGKARATRYALSTTAIE